MFEAPEAAAEAAPAWMAELNPEQARAVTTRSRSVLIVAGAGTGKTKTLAARVAHLLDEGAAPGRILFLTFTRRAAREMLASEEEPNGEVDVDEEPPRREPTTPIEELLRKGQDVLVQVSKESLGTKGARVTSFISLPGRYLVYMPQTSHIGVSRRIRDERERDRLRGVLRELGPPPGGFIVRTNAEGKGAEEFAADVAFLGRLWAQVNGRYEQSRAPAVLHQEMDLTFRVMRDLMSADVEEFVVDDPDIHARSVSDVQALVPALADRVKRYEGRLPIFETYGIEREIEKALRRRVWLKSGGYIVIDHTEALVSIDVNTGKYVGKRDFEQTVLKINLEAVNEVVRQIRLRDLGGIIIIDFIDMSVQEHRDMVLAALQRAYDAPHRVGRVARAVFGHDQAVGDEVEVVRHLDHAHGLALRAQLDRLVHRVAHRGVDPPGNRPPLVSAAGGSEWADVRPGVRCEREHERINRRISKLY